MKDEWLLTIGSQSQVLVKTLEGKLVQSIKAGDNVSVVKSVAHPVDKSLAVLFGTYDGRVSYFN